MFDAVIIGAGPAGSSAAYRLAKAGWRIALVERAAFPRRKVCGEFISAATLPLLQSCGIGESFFTHCGPPIRRVAVYAGNTMVDAPLPGEGRAMGREHLDTMLRDAALAAGAHLFQPADFLSVTRNKDGFACELDTATLQARIVIAATGSWNAKGPFALGPPPRASDLLAFKAHFRNGKLPDGVMPLLAFPGGYGGMVQTDGGRTSLSCCIRRDTLSTARARHHSGSGGSRAADAVFAHIREHVRGAAQALDGATAEDAFLAAGPNRPGIRARHQDGIFFTGNLAGEAHPVIAEGISMAIQASALLSDILLADPATAGARYEQQWQGRFAPRLRAASLFAHLAMNAPTRMLAAALVQRTPSLLTWGAALAGKA
jgi:flavin-dependent dehydrogenase